MSCFPYIGHLRQIFSPVSKLTARIEKEKEFLIDRAINHPEERPICQKILKVTHEELVMLFHKEKSGKGKAKLLETLFACERAEIYIKKMDEKDNKTATKYLNKTGDIQQSSKKKELHLTHKDIANKTERDKKNATKYLNKTGDIQQSSKKKELHLTHKDIANKTERDKKNATKYLNKTGDIQQSSKKKELSSTAVYITKPIDHSKNYSTSKPNDSHDLIYAKLEFKSKDDSILRIVNNEPSTIYATIR